jgi:hypothetical protein
MQEITTRDSSVRVTADKATIVGTYADDAEMKIVDATRPPSSPLVLRGRDAIGELYRDICSRAMSHEIQDAVVTPDKVAFNEACRYEDGLRVLSANTLDLRGGKIGRTSSCRCGTRRSRTVGRAARCRTALPGDFP